MFESYTKLKSRVETLEASLKSMTADRDDLSKRLSDATRVKEQEIKAIRLDHELEIKKKDFDMKHIESASVKTLRDEKVVLERNLAVAETKLEIMAKVTDVNADVLDVKDLVTKLIEKMPTININSIIAGLSGSKSESKE